MPLGKSGAYYMNPHEMQRKGDMPPAAKVADPAQPDQQQDGGEGEGGDGNRHHEIHEREDGSAQSIHTNADGTKEEMDHPSYEEACADCAGDGSDDEGLDKDEGEGGAPPMNSGGGDDMAGMYEQAGKK